MRLGSDWVHGSNATVTVEPDLAGEFMRLLEAIQAEVNSYEEEVEEIATERLNQLKGLIEAIKVENVEVDLGDLQILWNECIGIKGFKELIGDYELNEETGLVVLCTIQTGRKKL